MSLFISKIEVLERNGEFVPETLKITFATGSEVRYKRSNEGSSLALSTRKTLQDFVPPEFYFPPEEKCEIENFEALKRISDNQLRSIDDQHKSAVEQAELLYNEELEIIETKYKKEREAVAVIWKDLSEKLVARCRSFKKKVDGIGKDLSDTSARLGMMIRWLRESEKNEMLEAALLLESESAYIIANSVAEVKWHGFLSHVQKDSADTCRSIRSDLEGKGVALWYDKEVNRIDKRGMINGVRDSATFMIVLTHNFFMRPWCIFEYAVALVLERPVVTISEPDPRHGGGTIDSFSLPPLFRNLMDHEVIELSRTYWTGFITKLSDRIKDTVSKSDFKKVTQFVDVRKNDEERFSVGTAVWGQWVNGKEYYKGKIDKIFNGGQTFSIKYDDGDYGTNVPRAKVELVADWAVVADAKFNVGEDVMVCQGTYYKVATVGDKQIAVGACVTDSCYYKAVIAKDEPDNFKVIISGENKISNINFKRSQTLKCIKSLN